MALAFSVQAQPVQVIGSDSMVQAALAWAEAFSGSVEVSGGGSGIGVAALLDGSADIATLARPLQKDEAERLTKLFGAAPVVTPVAFDALAVFVHKDNPVSKISLIELRDVFFANGKLDDWKQLGGADSRRIIPASRHSNSAANNFFHEAVGGKRAEFKAFQMYSGSNEIVDAIASIPASIGYASLAFRRDGVKPLALSGNIGGEPVLPTAQTIRDGTYPLSRPLYFVSSLTARAETKAFIGFVTGKVGQPLVEKQGFTTLK